MKRSYSPPVQDIAMVLDLARHFLRSCYMCEKRKVLGRDIAEYIASKSHYDYERARRMLRLATNHSLTDGGDPIINHGCGYLLASNATPAERDASSRYYKSYAIALFIKSRRIRGASVPDDPEQLKLFLENGEEA